MDIVQTFYDKLASQYDQLFQDWKQPTLEQGQLLHEQFRKNGISNAAHILDCACGIGTQAIGLAALGYRMTASDISEAELKEAEKRAREHAVEIPFYRADFRALSEVFAEQFDVVIAMDNALPHMLTQQDLETAVKSISERVADGGLFVASIRDYDSLLSQRPSYSPPYIHQTAQGQRVSFQTWEWEGEQYKLIQYMITDENDLKIRKFECAYRATRRAELTDLLTAAGFREVAWLFPEETGFYQPIVIAKK